MSIVGQVQEDDLAKRKAYRDLQENHVGIFGISKCLQPSRNVYTGEITITNPNGRKEVWTEERGFVGAKYKRVK